MGIWTERLRDHEACFDEIVENFQILSIVCIVTQIISDKEISQPRNYWTESTQPITQEEAELFHISRHQHGPGEDPADEQEDHLHRRQAAMVLYSANRKLCLQKMWYTTDCLLGNRM